MISVIVPAYERRETLGTTLDSLLAQSFTAWEAVVVDDGSTDGTAAVAAAYAERDSRIRLYRQANAGVSQARNAGIELARAPWLFFLDADDWIVPEALAKLVAAVEADPEADVVYGGYVRVDASGRELQRQMPAHVPDFFPVFARTCAVSIHSCLVRTELVRKAGAFDAELVTCEDWDLWQRIARLGARFTPIPDYIARYRLRRGSASGSGRQMLLDGLRVIDRGHGTDLRLTSRESQRTPLTRSSRDMARTYFACYAAGLELAAGQDATALLTELGDGISGDVDAGGVADTLFHSVPVGLACGPADWERLPAELHRRCDRFIDALGERVGNHWLAFGARNELERLILGTAHEQRPRRSGRWYLTELDLAGEPPVDLELDAEVSRVLCDVRYGERPLGDVEIPLVDGWLPARAFADAIVAQLAWDVFDAYLVEHVYPSLTIEAGADRTRVERDGVVLFEGSLEQADARESSPLHDAIGWTLLLQELFELRWGSADDFYADRGTVASERRRVAGRESVALDVADPLPLLELGKETSIAVLVTVGGVPLTVTRCRGRDGLVTPDRLRRAILLQTGFELCRVVMRESIVLAPGLATGSLRQRLTMARDRREAAGETVLPSGATVIGRGVGADGTAVSRWNVLPAAAAPERLELARLDGSPFAGPGDGQVKRLLCAPALLREGNSRHPSDDTILRLHEFEQIFGARVDPWSYDSPYEQEKYRQTLSLLPDAVEDALEIGCAEGVFTRRLADRARRLTAVDIAPRALMRARHRCQDCSNVSFEQLDVFEEALDGSYDLIVCSELLYYAPDLPTLTRTAEALVNALRPGGHLLTTHAHAVVDDERSPGFDWDVPFGAAAIERALLRTRALDLQQEIRTTPYRVQLYGRRTRRRVLPARQRVVRTDAAAAAMTPANAARFSSRGGRVRREQDEDGARASRLPILMYHRVAPHGAPGTHRYRLHPDAFEAQLRHLRDRGYNSLTFEQWRAASDRRLPLPKRSVILTFDDGYADFPTYALPLLRRYGFQASMFVVTDLVGGTNVWDHVAGEALDLMDWPTLLGLQGHGIELGSHTSSHRPLISLSPADVAHDLCRSRACLHERTGVPVRSVCYPYGLNDVAVRALAAACGFHYGLTTDEWQASFGDDLLGLPRLEVRGTQSLDSFAEMFER